MNRPESALLSLLRAGLWMTEPATDGVFPLTEEEWAEVYEQSKKQTVSALVLQGINLMNEELMPPLPLLQRWAINVDRIEKQNKKQDKIQREIIQWLKSLNLQPKVLKGQGVAQMYEHPTQRVCGDIDIFFPTPDDQQKAWEAAKEKGSNPERVPLGAFNFTWDGIEVECHRRMLDISNPFCKQAMKQLVEIEAKSDSIYPTPLVNLLLLNTHILKHMLSHGIGLRQFADIARAYHTLKGQYNETEYAEWCKRLNIDRWTRELNGFLTEYLGLPPDDLPQAETADRSRAFILEKVLTGGNFGFYGTSRAAQSASRLSKRWHTFRALVTNCKHTLRLAPSENIWMILQLSKGDR